MEKVNLKILSDIHCELYVDLEFVTDIKKDTLIKIPLPKGEYLITLRSTINPQVKYEGTMVLLYDKVYKANFIPTINSNPDLIRDCDLVFSRTRGTYYNLLTNQYLAGEWDFGFPFSEGLACVVNKENKRGYIDKNGKLIIDFLWCHEAQPFQNGKACIGSGDSWSIIDNSGRDVFPHEDDADVYRSVTFIDKDIIDVSPYYGWDKFINLKIYNHLIERYDAWGSYKDGYTPVRENGLWGFCDEYGNLIIECVYDEIGGIHSGVFLVERDGKWGGIDQKGHQVIPFIYDSLRSRGDYIVAGKELLGMIDDKNNIIIPFEYDTLGFTGLRKDTKSAPMTISQTVYDEVGYFHKGIACVCQNGKWGYINKKIEEIIPCIYDEVNDFTFVADDYPQYYFEDEMPHVSLNGKHGCYNRDGKLIIPCEFDVCCAFHDGLSAVRQNDKTGFYDLNGNQIIPCIYDGFHCHQQDDGLISICLNGKGGIIDKFGKVVIPFIYDYGPSYSHKTRIVDGRKDGVYGYWDKYGNPLLILGTRYI